MSADLSSGRHGLEFDHRIVEFGGDAVEAMPLAERIALCNTLTEIGVSGVIFPPLSPTGAELLFEVFSQRYERGSTLVTSNMPFDEWTSVFGSERLTGALLDRLTHHVHILEMNGDSFRLAHSKRKSRRLKAELPPDEPAQA